MYLQRTQLKSDGTWFGTKNKKYLLALAAAVLQAAHKAVSLTGGEDLTVVLTLPQK